ncbi:phage antirepressor KilAC domain-containing protein [Candidatus Fukatsuia endosymbiont of Tuberolachnus salignus]|uniref:phage antirepressor KilAC domain-containing protein n=1 Tax=Candidatus Fukatsuia endosymbiont of Tuberolachnus salignus TaxID=3077957 RepID=UPI003CC79FD2
MNPLSNAVNPSMGSREIAGLVESRHDNVKRAIERLVEKGIIRLPPMEEVKNQSDQYVFEYRVGKRDSYVVVAQLSPEFTARVVDRWQQLEEKAAYSFLPVDYLSALKTLTQEVERRQRLENPLARAAPKIDFADRVSEASGILVGNFAKLMGLRPNKLFVWLRKNHVLMGIPSRRNVPRQEYLERDYFTFRETPIETEHGMKITFTPLLTGKGQAWLTKKLCEAGLLKTITNAA